MGQKSRAAYKTIVIIHPGAIGDVVMGTPVALTLKANFPQARIVYLTHPSLFPLLALCPGIDSFVEWYKQSSIFELSRQLNAFEPNLLIDLVGSLRTRLVCALTKGATLTLKKQKDSRTWIHLVDNYLSTLAPLELKPRQPVFPTFRPEQGLLDELSQDEDLKGESALVGLVPGVGKHRPNRAWPAEKWAMLGSQLILKHRCKLVLVGGADDEAVCAEVKKQIGQGCVNFGGSLSLPQTAALLSKVQLVVSADTGPAHIAAALGRPVVSLTGPTDPLRTGPFASAQFGINVGLNCKCKQAKHCLLNDGLGAGECMRQIEVEDVLQKVERLLVGQGLSAGSS